tara:strand:- start:246 stop:536 length:291 start_codon:yes stop_codon:yes gene_type:complete
LNCSPTCGNKQQTTQTTKQQNDSKLLSMRATKHWTISNAQIAEDQWQYKSQMKNTWIAHVPSNHQNTAPNNTPALYAAHQHRRTLVRLLDSVETHK